MTFDPGLDSMRAAGIPVTRQGYSSGQAGIRQSLEAMAQKMREGKIDAGVKSWALDCLKAKGLDGRDRGTTAAKQAAAILDCLRSATVYTSDPYGTESVQTAGATLCLRPNLCIKGGDCIPEGTLLLRDDFELISIEKIRPGDRIWGRDKWTLVEAVAFKGNLTVDAIEMNNGSTMLLTTEHKVFAGRCRHDRGPECPTCYPKLQRERFERITVADLREGEVLLQPERISFGEGQADPDRMYVEGLALADGWVNDGRNCFYVAGRDGMRKEAQKHEVKAICDRLGIATRWHKRYITVKDAPWAQRIAELGKRARFKHLETINLSETVACEALRGVMADSTANTNGPGRTFSTTSRTLMVQVRLLQRMFGIATSVRMLTPEQHGGAGKHPLWRVGIRAGDSKALAVRSIERAVRKAPCWDVQTEDHYVYLPEHDVTVSNCDDLSVALGAMYLSIGLPTQIVKQNFGGDAQEHVLIAVYDGTDWRYADPSTNMPFGSAASAVSEVWVDPMEPIGNLPEAQAEIVTLGKVSRVKPKPMGSTTPHWGMGSILGYPTVSDLLSLVDVAAYNLQQLQAVDCPGWPNDPAGYADWQKDLQQLKVDFDATVKYVNAYIGDQPKWAYDWSVVLYPWDQVRDIIGREVDLDRRLRANGSCQAPSYSETPQPKGLDPDLWAYQASGTVLKEVRTVAENARQPVTIVLGGAVLGGVLTLGGLLLLDRLLRPIRR